MNQASIIIRFILAGIFGVAGAGVGISVFDSSSMALFLCLLAIFIANISFYIEILVKEKCDEEI